MSTEATITINGTALTEEQSAIVRMSVEAFTIVMEPGVTEDDPGVVAALTDAYKQALTTVQMLLADVPQPRVN